MNSRIIDSNQIEILLRRLLLEKIENLNPNTFVLEASKISSSLNDKAQKSLFDVFSTYAFKAETVAPLASKFFIQYVISKKELEVKVLNYRKEHTKKIFESLSSDSVAQIFEQIVEICGLKTKLVISDIHSSRDKTVIELMKGFTFENLSAAIDVGKTEILNPKIFCIDGFLESVSEIHHVLESLYSSKESAILFIRGASDEVLHTLKVNFDRKTLMCIPVVVNYDLEGSNVLNDLAVISNSNLISSLKGDLISSIETSSTSSVDSVSFLQPGIVIKNFRNSINIDLHIANLQSKVLENNNEISNSILSKRIQRLGAEQINLFLSEKHKKEKLAFDRCIRAIKSCSDYGVIILGNDCFPAASIQAGEFFAKKFLQHVKDIGCIVV